MPTLAFFNTPSRLVARRRRRIPCRRAIFTRAHNERDVGRYHGVVATMDGGGVEWVSPSAFPIFSYRHLLFVMNYICLRLRRGRTRAAA